MRQSQSHMVYNFVELYSPTSTARVLLTPLKTGCWRISLIIIHLSFSLIHLQQEVFEVCLNRFSFWFCFSAPMSLWNCLCLLFSSWTYGQNRHISLHYSISPYCNSITAKRDFERYIIKSLPYCQWVEFLLFFAYLCLLLTSLFTDWELISYTLNKSQRK